MQRANSCFASTTEWRPEGCLHPANKNRDRQKSGCYMFSHFCFKVGQIWDDYLQLSYSTRSRKYSLYSYLDTSTAEEAAAVHSKTTPAESSQESQVQPSFRFLCCKKNSAKQNKTTAQNLVQMWSYLCTAVRINQHEYTREIQPFKFLT